MIFIALHLARTRALALAISYVSSFEGLPRTALAVAIITVTSNAGRMVSIFLALYLLSERGLSTTWIGLIVGAYGAGAVIGSLAGGWLCSYCAPRTILSASLICSAAAFVFVVAVDSPWIVFGLILIGASFEGSIRPPTLLFLLQDAPPADQPRCYAVYQTALNIGYAVAAAAGGVIASVSFSLIFVVNGIAGLIAATAALMWLPRGTVVAQSSHGTSPDSSRATSFRWPFAILCIAVLLNYSVANQRLSTYPLYLASDYGLDTAQFGTLMMMNGILIAVATIVVANKLKLFDQRWVAGFGSLLLCGSFAMLPAGDSIEFAFLACLTLTVGEMLFMPSVVSLVYRFSQARAAGTTLGFFYSISSACRSVGPLTGMWLMSAFGSVTLWAICGLVGVATLIALPRLKLPS